MSKNYNPSQPRHPAGSPLGGQWSSEDEKPWSEASYEKARAAASLPPQSFHDNQFYAKGKWALYKGKVYTVGEFNFHAAIAKNLGISLDQLDARGIWGYFKGNYNDPKFPLMGVYEISKMDMFMHHYFKILDKTGQDNPTIYTTKDLINWKLYDPKKAK